MQALWVFLAAGTVVAHLLRNATPSAIAEIQA
jgi:hypothetical protein